jgi:hypothetical protein
MSINRMPGISCCGECTCCGEHRGMSGGMLLATVLIAGGVIYMVIFLWVTHERLKEIGPPKAPGDH